MLPQSQAERMRLAVDELSLIAAAQRGDVTAFNQLVQIFQGVVYNVAYRVLHDQDAAADATQEAFLAAFHALPGFRGGSFKAWLLRIVTNGCYDQLRAAQRRPTTSLDDMEVDQDHSSWLLDDSESPEEYAIRQDLGRTIQAGLDELPPDQRVTVILSDIQGLSYEEIAASTGVELGTVKSRLSRARARLREYLLRNRELFPEGNRLMGKSPEQGT